MARKPAFPYVQRSIGRDGRLRLYLRKPGLKRVLLPEPEGGPEFLAAYHAAMASPDEPVGASRTIAGSINALVVSYYGSNAFKVLRPSTQKVYRNICERLRDQHGDKSVAAMEPRHVRALMAAKSETPHAANKLLMMLRILLDHAVDIDMRDDNPAANVKRLKHKSEGFATWSEQDIATFRAHWAIGTRERLAFELLLGTGQRRGDVVRMGWRNLSGGTLSVKQEKTGAMVVIPVLPELRAVLDALPRDRLTFLSIYTGAPFSSAGFGNWFRDIVREAGLPDSLSSHGLRKACARRLAEAGCTASEIASVTGHATLREVERYTREADRARMARAASGKVHRMFGDDGE